MQEAENGINIAFLSDPNASEITAFKSEKWYLSDFPYQMNNIIVDGFRQSKYFHWKSFEKQSRWKKSLEFLSSTFLCHNALHTIPQEMKSGQFCYQEIGQIFRT